MQTGHNQGLPGCCVPNAAFPAGRVHAGPSPSQAYLHCSLLCLYRPWVWSRGSWGRMVSRPGFAPARRRPQCPGVCVASMDRPHWAVLDMLFYPPPPQERWHRHEHTLEKGLRSEGTLGPRSPWLCRSPYEEQRVSLRAWQGPLADSTKPPLSADRGVHRRVFQVLCRLGKTASLPPLAPPHPGQSFLVFTEREALPA